MNPTPAQTIAGIRRVLKEVVEPAVESEYALDAVRGIRAVLAQIDWDDVLPALAAETADTARLAREVADWIVGDPLRENAFAQQLPALTDPEWADALPVDSFAVHNARSIRAAEALIAFHGRLAEWLAEHPDDVGAEVMSRVRRHYAAPTDVRTRGSVK